MKTIFLYTLIVVSCINSFGQNQQRPNIPAPMGLSVNSFTGNLFYQHTDLTLKGTTFPLYGTFYYNASVDTTDYGFGHGWNFYYNVFYTESGDTVLIHRSDAKIDTFRMSGSAYLSPAGVFDVLSKSGSEYVLTEKNGNKHFFSNPVHKKITRMTDPSGNYVELDYQGNKLSKIRNNTGRAFELTWNGDDLQMLKDSILPEKNYQYEYDDKKDLISITDPLTNKRTISYDKHRITKLSDENGNPAIIEYTIFGKVQTIRSCSTKQDFSFLDSLHKSFVTQNASAGSLVTGFEFDAQGRLGAVTNADSKKVTFAYDNNNNILSSTDWNGRKTSFTYDGKGNLLSQTDPQGNTEYYTYESQYNKLSTLKNKKGQTTTFTYDTQGNLLTVKQPDNTTQTYTYYSDGKLKTSTNARGKTTSYEYNDNEDLITTTYPIGAVHYEYTGSCCNLSKITDANGNSVSMTYDLLNRVKTVTDDRNNTILYDYDGAGNLLSERDPNGNVKFYGYDELNRLKEVTLPSAGTWHYVYDGSNNLTGMTDANGNTTLFDYDELNRLMKETDPIGNATSYSYDANNNLLKKTFPNGNIINYTYDELDRLTSKSYPGNTDNYSYDANGNLLSAYNNNITYTFEYDNLDRLIKKNIPTWSKSISYSYDAAGNRATMTDHDGGIYNYVYDENNRLTSLKNAFNLVTGFQYDLGGRLVKQTNANNTFATYHYDNAGRIDSIENKKSSNDFISKFYYSFDKLGNRTAMTDKRGVNTYGYDSSYRLTNVHYSNGSVESFKIDPTGNRTERTKDNVTTAYSYNKADEIQTAGTASFNFDANGNTTSEADTVQKAFAYDGENRLVNATINNTKQVVYKYDPFGDKIERIDTNGTVTRMIYDFDNLISELNSNNTTIKKYTTSLDVDGWLSINSNSNNYFFHKDGLNSTSELTDNNSLLMNEYYYDVYGNIISYVTAVKNNLLYAGRFIDSGIGLYDYRSRFYQSSTGRFLKKDILPLMTLEPLSINKYTYVEDNSVNYNDPHGLYGLDPNSYAHIMRNCKNQNPSVGQDFKPNIDDPYFIDSKGNKWIKQSRGKSVFHNFADDQSPFDKSTVIWQYTKGFAFQIAEFGLAQIGYDLGNSPYNIKYLQQNKSGNYTGSEAIWNIENSAFLLSGNKNGPSYNYGADPSLGSGHFSKDMVPDFWNPLYGRCPPEDKKDGNQNPPPTNDNNGDGKVDDKDKTGNDGNPHIDIPIVRSKDPNEIVGTAGLGSLKWVSSKDRLSYKIYFENDPDFATAPAQRVTVYMPISDKLNPNTIVVGDFGFGSFNFTVPANTVTYSSRLDVKDSLGVYVDVTAGLDIPNRRAFWIFQSIDPATGLSSSLAAGTGFLPVNDSLTHKGEGYVNVSFVPADGVATRDTAVETASIVFDNNETIGTNTWKNTIDAVAPTSSVSPLLPLLDTTFTVSWSGHDDTLGTGIRDYELYSSKNGGTFTLYRANIDSTVTSFTGDPGATYSFYTRATDRTGNKEPAKNAGEQATTVKGNALFVSIKAFLGGAYQSSGQLMYDSLRTKRLLPLSSPYKSLGFTAVNNNNTEAIAATSLDSAGSTALVDWIWIELRSATNAKQVIATRSAFIRRDGKVVDLDGSSAVFFPGSIQGNYYIAIRHRNHLGVMTANIVSLQKDSTAFIDFANPLTATYGVNAQQNINDVMTMWPGDANGNGGITYNGASNDKNAILSLVGLNTSNNIITAYSRADGNLDGKVSYNGAANDKNKVLGSTGLTTPNNIITEQLPK